MDQFFSNFKAELISIGLVVLGAAFKALKDEIGYRLKRKYGIDVAIDKAVLNVETTTPQPGQGSVKKEMVKNQIKEHLKAQGVGLLKSVIVSIFGRIGSSINKSVDKNINRAF